MASPLKKEKDEQTTPFMSGPRHERSGQATVRFFFWARFLQAFGVFFVILPKCGPAIQWAPSTQSAAAL